MRGDTFTSQLVVNGAGTSAANIIVGAYGTGPDPIFDAAKNLSAIEILLLNNDYVTVQDLTLQNSGVGVGIANTNGPHSGYEFSRLNLYGNGVGISSPVDGGAWLTTDVRIDDVVGENNNLLGTGCTCNAQPIHLSEVAGVVVNRLYSSDNCGSTSFYGLGATNVTVLNSVSTGDAGCSLVQGNTANFVSSDTNTTFVNDIITNVPPDTTADQTGIDVEPIIVNTGINIEDNYIADNAGPAIEILNRPAGTTNLNIWGNLLESNSQSPNPAFLRGQIWTARLQTGSPDATGTITNNLYYSTTTEGGFERNDKKATFNGFTQANNQDIGSLSNAWYAANGFSCSVQGANNWTYQSSSDGSTWTNFNGCQSVNPLDNEWDNDPSNAGGFVSNFEELPSATPSDWVSRSWTSPLTGTATIRGRVLMTDTSCPSGVTAEITVNSSTVPIWNQSIAAGDGVGQASDLDQVALNAGDVVHFAVQDAGSSQCRVSWTPSIALDNPIATVTAPLYGATLSGTQLVTATASARAGVRKVQFYYVNDKEASKIIGVATFVSGQWQYSWNTTLVANGSYMIYALVTDKGGGTAYSVMEPITIFN